MSSANVDLQSWERRRARTRQLLRTGLLWLSLAGVVAIVFVARQIENRADQTGCPTAHAEALVFLEGLQPSSLTIELAGNRQRLARQLHPVKNADAASAPSLAERVCIERRIQTGWDELTRLDAPLFMPLYGLFSLLLAAWIALQPAEPAAQHRWPVRRQVLAALAIVAATVLLLALDRMENASALVMLIDAERGPLMTGDPTALDALAVQARDASLIKWAAAVLWTTSLAVGVGLLASPRRPQRWAQWIAVALFILSAVLFTGSVGHAWLSQAFGAAVRGLQMGFAAALLGACAAAFLLWATPERSAIPAPPKV